VTVAFSQSTFTASEGDGIALVCAELLTGVIKTEISLLVDAIDLESNTGAVTRLLSAITDVNAYLLL
jgi:hypothetical protein